MITGAAVFGTTAEACSADEVMIERTGIRNTLDTASAAMVKNAMSLE